MRKIAGFILLAILCSAGAGVASEPGEGLVPLKRIFRSDRQIGYLSWKPVDFRKAVRAGFNTVWIGIGPFVALSSEEQEGMVRRAMEADLKILGFIGGDPSWARQDRRSGSKHAVQEYRQLLHALGRLAQEMDLGYLRFAFAVDVEPHTQGWWEGDLAGYSELLKMRILPMVEEFAQEHPWRVARPMLTRFEPFWWENGHVTESGRVIRGLQDFPSGIASMTYRNNALELEEVSRQVRQRAKRAPGVVYLLGVETKPAGPGIPSYITFHGRVRQIGRELQRAIEAMPPEDRTRLRGVFVHAGRDYADEVLDQLD